MSWRKTSPMLERKSFVKTVRNGLMNVSEACRYFGVSRTCGYKWLERYGLEGEAGLSDRSRAPLNHPNATDEQAAELITLERKRRPAWGPRKLIAYLSERHPDVEFPSPSAAGAILSRHGLVRPRSRRRSAPPQTYPFADVNGPNSVWSADFKGQFRMSCGLQVYPLTVADSYSRYLLSLAGFDGISWRTTRRVFERLFIDHGLPIAILTDNGPPFASVGLGGLTLLSAWWVRLGITHDRIKPGHPEQNGRHERMHGALEREVERPEGGLGPWQRAFDNFRHTYNHERPHEALDMKPPASVYAPSPRPYPAKEAEVEYPQEYTIRRVRSNGEIKWDGGKIYCSQTLAGEPVGLIRTSEEFWDIYYGKLKLGKLDERTGKIYRPSRT